MNGFEIIAENYRIFVKQGKLTEEQAKREIEIYDFLAKCDNTDLCRLVDSGAFNDIIKAIIKATLSKARVSKKTEEKILSEVRYTFDEMTAMELYERFI